MEIEYNVYLLYTNELVYKETNHEKEIENNFNLMRKSLKFVVNAIENKYELNGKDFYVKVINKEFENKVESFNFMQVYLGDCNNE